MEETPGWRHLACILREFQDPLVELGALLETHLADLGDLPPDVVGVPWPESPDMAFLTTDRVLALAQGNAPAFDGTLGSFTGSDGSDICIGSGLDNICQGDF